MGPAGRVHRPEDPYVSAHDAGSERPAGSSLATASNAPTRHDDALLFVGGDGTPFHAATIYRRADRAWADAELAERLRLHQARHSYASFMIAAGINAKALSVFMGHSSIKVTFDLYGHLMPGTEAEAAALLDVYLGAQGPLAPIKAVASTVL